MLNEGLDADDADTALGANVVAAAGAILEPEEVAARVLEAIATETFLVLPHPEVLDFYRRKGTDYDRWIARHAPPAGPARETPELNLDSTLRAMSGMNFELTDRCKDYQERVQAFMDERIYPAEAVYEEQMRGGRRPALPPADPGGAEGGGARAAGSGTSSTRTRSGARA